MPISTIFEICNAYESGVGHGTNRDGLSAGPYSNGDLNEAYEYGYEQGEETAVIDTAMGVEIKEEVLEKINHLVSQEHLKELGNRMHPNGVIVAEIITTLREAGIEADHFPDAGKMV